MPPGEISLDPETGNYYFSPDNGGPVVQVQWDSNTGNYTPIGEPTVEIPTGPPAGSEPDMPAVPPPPLTAPVDIYGDPIPPGSAPDMPAVPPPPLTAPVDIYGDPIQPDTGPTQINPATGTPYATATAPAIDPYAIDAAGGLSPGINVDFGTAHFDGGGLYAGMISGRGLAARHSGGPIGQTDPFLTKLFNLKDHEVPIVGLDSEYMMPPEAHAHYGTRGMDLIKNMRVPADRIALHDGGPISGSSSVAGSDSGNGMSGDVKVGIHSHFDINELMRKLQSSDDHKQFIWDVVRGRVHEVGLRV
jgi:hypothetical protein